MKRPSRFELVQKMWPELAQKSDASIGDKEAAIGINTRAAEAIAGDFIGLFDAGYAEKGPGVLSVPLIPDRKAQYLTIEDLQDDADHAVSKGDHEHAEKVGDVVSFVKSFNYNKGVVIVLADYTRFLCLPISRDNPASAITAMMEEMVG